MGSELEKRNAAIAAMEFVEEGMTLGLGTGSTAKHFVEPVSYTHLTLPTTPYV